MRREGGKRKERGSRGGEERPEEERQEKKWKGGGRKEKMGKEEREKVNERVREAGEHMKRISRFLTEYVKSSHLKVLH